MPPLPSSSSSSYPGRSGAIVTWRIFAPGTASTFCFEGVTVLSVPMSEPGFDSGLGSWVIAPWPLSRCTPGREGRVGTSERATSERNTSKRMPHSQATFWPLT